MKKKRILIILITLIIVVGVLVRFGLPTAMSAMGLHPEYEGQRYLLPEGKALIISTSHDRLGDGGDKTGVFGSELTAPYYEFKDGRMSVDVASIKGGKIPIDPNSFRWFIKSEYDDRFLSDPALQGKVENSLLIDGIDFTKYDIIYLAGGWGAAYDLGYSEILGQKITEAYAAGKVIGGVCHGPLGLLMARDEHGQPLVQGRKVTAVTDKQVKELGISITPQHPERELRAAGVKFESATAFRDMFANHVVVDGRIVSGQNQNAGAEVANLMMKVAGGARR
ncbi:MAG: type 1 glutamine amidotransferase domain-containing protein [Deltaproteobacteria bacterium HGW-Deltaproteobacteria-12]|jgi:putative intracellular protease/amidase|nr:MAG: type 1 glutamine amidotransferase domain-containing protein [Deltaproteobacteria bacterium HGW-Deltaproteobacteria-12]